jgi:hypothetical protein
LDDFSFRGKCETPAPSENFSAEKLKWRGFLRSRIETIEMAEVFGCSELKFLKWRGGSGGFAMEIARRKRI